VSVRHASKKQGKPLAADGKTTTWCSRRESARQLTPHTSGLKADRQVANTLAELIIGGSLASTAVTNETGGRRLGEAP
jgi:hypothetical protein